MDGASFKIDGSAGSAGRGRDFIIFKRPPGERRRLIGIGIYMGVGRDGRERCFDRAILGDTRWLMQLTID